MSCPTCHSPIPKASCPACAGSSEQEGGGGHEELEGAFAAPVVDRSGLDAERAFLFDAARRALAFARVYRAEEGRGGGARERACLTEVANLRALLSRARERTRTLASSRLVASASGPGLKKSRDLEVSPETTRRGRTG